MDSSIMAFFGLVLVVVVVEIVFVKVYKRMKAKQEAQFTVQHVGSSLDDIHAALDCERYEVQRCETYAAVAHDEGDARSEYFFRILAKGEQVHVEVLLDLLKQLDLRPRAPKKVDDVVVGTTMENLQAAVDEQEGAMCELYAAFAKNASKNKQREIAKTFKRFHKAERAHADIVRAYLAEYEAGGTETKIAMCPSCGSVELGTPNAFCIVCSQPGFHYERFQGFPQRQA